MNELQLEIRDKRVSWAVSVASILIFFLMTASWWQAILFPVPPSESAQYVTLGAIDFGNFHEGSGNVNNFLDPSKTPGPEKPAPAENTAPQPVKANVAPEPVVTGSEVSEVKTPEVKPVPVPTKPVVNPTPAPVVNTPPVKPKPSNSALYDNNDNGTAKTGGSNHGEGTEVGNRGNPSSKVLYDQGGDQGDGVGIGPGGPGTFSGLKNRKAVSTPMPVYNVQTEAKLSFEFKIAPDGSVSFVKRPVTPYTDLAKAGQDAIYKWKFNALEDEAPDQWVTVTITFKLK